MGAIYLSKASPPNLTAIYLLSVTLMTAVHPTLDCPLPRIGCPHQWPHSTEGGELDSIWLPYLELPR